MRSIAELRIEARRIFERKLGSWAWSTASASAVEGFPLSLALGTPNQAEITGSGTELFVWSDSWNRHSGAGTVTFVSKKLRYSGTQTLPARLEFTDAAGFAAFVGARVEWNRIVARLGDMTTEWPRFTQPKATTVRRILDLDESHWHRVLDFLRWADGRDFSSLLPRQIPVPGVDSKWFEANRSLLAALHEALTGESLQVRGLDSRVILRVLDPRLRKVVGGLGEFSASAEQLSRLAWRPSEVIISENKQSAYSFGERQGSVVLAAQGYAVDVYGRLPWIRDSRVAYWGDIDTHGFAILNRLRRYLPDAQSLLMDEATLLAHRSLWAVEEKPSRGTLPLLTDGERTVYEALVSEEYGVGVRLEQERIPWIEVEAAFSIRSE